MIRTLADLLQRLATAENERLAELDIKHPPTIGNMYEGLTGHILSYTLFDGLDLKVIRNSFIEGCQTEFDVMLVQGEGKQVPYSEQYHYAPENVIAVIQVKKNLHGKDLRDGFRNLQFIIDNYEKVGDPDYSRRLFRDSFRATYSKDIDAELHNEQERHIYHTLRVESVLPVRIIIGYNGFASEYNLRESMANMLYDNLTTDLDNPVPGFGPHNFPNLIICGPYSIIKMDGMPFGSPIDKTGWWHLMGTSCNNPMGFFLEKILTRLTYQFGTPDDLFGEDLSVEPVKPFLDCKFKELNGYSGWEYNYRAYSQEKLSEELPEVKWEPVELDSELASVIHVLGIREEIDLFNDPHLQKLIDKSTKYHSIDELVKILCDGRITYIENGKLRFLTDYCQTVFIGGKAYAADNKADRLTKWAMKKQKEFE